MGLLLDLFLGLLIISSILLDFDPRIRANKLILINMTFNSLFVAPYLLDHFGDKASSQLTKLNFGLN